MDNEKNNPIEKLAAAMYIKNRRNSDKLKAFGSYQTLCLTESFVLRNRKLLLAAKRYRSV
jgi:hypothetical protein